MTGKRARLEPWDCACSCRGSPRIHGLAKGRLQLRGQLPFIPEREIRIHGYDGDIDVAPRACTSPRVRAEQDGKTHGGSALERLTGAR
jgi:hypothetical protein